MSQTPDDEDDPFAHLDRIEQDSNGGTVDWTPLAEWHRPVKEQDFTKADTYIESKPRASFYDGMTKTNSWTRERIKILCVKHNNRRYTLACETCGNTREEPRAFCPHRAYLEYLQAAQTGQQYEYDELPDSWSLEYDDYKENDYNFNWDLAFPDGVSQGGDEHDHDDDPFSEYWD